MQVDPVHLARVIDNLVGNAIRHTPHGGRVAVRAVGTTVIHSW
jgi:signal transduction histidine kinase